MSNYSDVKLLAACKAVDNAYHSMYPHPCMLAFRPAKTPDVGYDM